MLTFEQILTVISLWDLSLLVEVIGVEDAAVEVTAKLIHKQDIVNPIYSTGPMFKDVINILNAYL